MVPVVAPPFDPNNPPRPYSPRDTYSPGERIVHPTFGTGVVAATPGPGKVDVVFPAGNRTLACAKAESTLERPVAVSNVPIGDRPPARKMSAPEPETATPTARPGRARVLAAFLAYKWAVGAGRGGACSR